MKTRTLAPAQLAYAQAAARCDLIRDLIQRDTAHLSAPTRRALDADDVPELDRLEAERMAVEKRHGYPEACRAIRQAEDELLAWAKGVLEQHPDYKRLQRTHGDPGCVWATRYIDARRALIRICMRLDA